MKLEGEGGNKILKMGGLLINGGLTPLQTMPSE